MKEDPLLQELNDKQKDAVTTTDGAVLVLAGAGSGKTKVLTHRIAYILREKLAYPEQILAVTFTNKAAGEIKERVGEIIGKGAINRASTYRNLPWSGTFHSICARILRIDGEKIGISRSFTIYDPQDQQRVIRSIMKESNIDTKQFNPRAILSFISNAKSQLITPSEYQKHASGPFQSLVAEIYPKYQKVLKQNQALDFDDLLMRTVELFKKESDVLKKYQNLFKYILVDEYQDTNYAQYAIIKVLSEKYKNIFVVGDDAQSIYKWRGADIRNILEFEKDYSKVLTIKLEQNYRSTKVILEATNAIIKQNKSQKPKKLWTENIEGELIKLNICENERQEAKTIIQTIIDKGMDLDKTAILYRTNAQSRILEEEMMNYQIPYRLVGNVRFYDRKEVKDVLAYLRLIANPNDDISFLRAITTPKRGIGDTTLDKLQLLASKLNLSLLEALNQIQKYNDKNLFGDSTVGKLQSFAQLLNIIISELPKRSLLDFLKLVLEKTRIMEQYSEKNDEDLSRIENIKEFLNTAIRYKDKLASESLDEFLEDVSLIEDQSKEDTNVTRPKVTLMTIHSAKGLEFENVFVTGLEENLFPHSRSYTDPLELEEERRLAYVAFTRAKKFLTLTYAQNRTFYGSRQQTIPSRFISELPQNLIEILKEGYEEEIESNDNYEKSETNQSFQLKEGDRVKSEFFGKGTILSIDEDVVRIQFDRKGVKELATEYARLSAIS